MFFDPKKREDYVHKHEEEERKRVKSVYPDIGTYNPQAVDYLTFGRMMKLSNHSSSKDATKGFGTD